MSEQNAVVPHAPCARPSSTSRRRLLRLALAWPAATLPLFWQSPAAEAVNSSAEWSADPEAAQAAKLLKEIGSAYWIQEGAGPRIVYIFFDPNCPFSHKLYLATRAEVGKGGLQLRWIPVGQLEASSPGKAAAILAAPDPLTAFHKNEDDWNFGDSPAGGIRPLAHPSARVLHQLQINAALMRQANLHTFPVMLYRTANGRAHLIVGLLPEDAIATVLRSAS